jgi:hypothetical protein
MCARGEAGTRAEGYSSFFYCRWGRWGRSRHRTFFRTFFEPWSGSVEADAYPCFEGCGLGATCGNRGQRTRLQRRLSRLRGCFVFGFSVAVGR